MNGSSVPSLGAGENGVRKVLPVLVHFDQNHVTHTHHLAGIGLNIDVVGHQDAWRLRWLGQFMFNESFQGFGLLFVQRHVVKKRPQRCFGLDGTFVQKLGGIHTSAPRAAENVGACNALLAEPSANGLGLLFTRIAQVALGRALAQDVAGGVSIPWRIGMSHQQDMLAIL